MTENELLLKAVSIININIYEKLNNDIRDDEIYFDLIKFSFNGILPIITFLGKEIFNENNDSLYNHNYDYINYH